MTKKQQNKIILIVVIVAVVVIAFFAAGPFYILNEGDQAVITRFGQIVDVQPDAGLRVKFPLIDQVVIYPKRIMSWDGDPRLMPTAEKQFIWVDTTARWKIKDPRVFYSRINTVEAANTRIRDVIESAVRTVIAENNLSAEVRNTNIINEVKPTSDSLIQSGVQDENSEVYNELQTLIETTDTYPALAPTEGRRNLSQKMIASAKPALETLGIQVIDIIIRQIRYSDEVTESVYNRMISERNRIANAYRSVGEGRKNELLGQMENELKTINSEAYRQAQTIMGEADAKASQIYSTAYSRDSEFFRFWRAMESYKKTLGGFTKTLSTDMDYFRYLYSINGR